MAAGNEQYGALGCSNHKEIQKLQGKKIKMAPEALGRGKAAEKTVEKSRC